MQCVISSKSLASSHAAGIKGIWNLQKSSSDSFDTYLVLAFVGETRILEINAEDELDEAEIEGFDAEQQVYTLHGISITLLPVRHVKSRPTSAMQYKINEGTTSLLPPSMGCRAPFIRCSTRL